MATGSSVKSQNYDYFLVLDFEATCDNRKKMDPQEIIEFPVLKVSGKTFEVEAEFHHYVEPMVHKELSKFCTDLTGITQEMVDGKPLLSETLNSFYAWMNKEGLLDSKSSFIFVTCGDWDLKIMLPTQCKSSHYQLSYPDYLKRWINIKKVHSRATGVYGDLMVMLQHIDLKHIGRHHSGIDDCKNIANILKALAEKSHVFKETGKLM